MAKRMERWIIRLIDGLDEHVDEDTRAKVLEQCGRQCQSESFVKKARSIYERSKNMDEFLEKLEEVYKHLQREGENVYIVYPKCYCSFVKDPPRETLGNILQVFSRMGKGTV